MRLDEACEEIFARHETFHPRLTWFRKAFLASAHDNGRFFLSEDAPVRLGVGKNMVRSIRFWGSAAHLVAEVPNPDRPRTNRTMPTNLGAALLGPSGLDPYMEDLSTWWWIHWMLVAPGCQLPVWWILLNELNVVEFDDELAFRVSAATIEASTFEAPHESSIIKDLTAFLRTYAVSPTGRGKFDDQFGCPLRDLKIVTTSAGKHRFATEPPPDLPGDVVLAAVLDFMALNGAGARTGSLGRLASTLGSPARGFRLTEEHLLELLSTAVKHHRPLRLSSAAGSPQLGWAGDPAEHAHEVLCVFYDADPDRPSAAGPMARLANVDRKLELSLLEHGRGVVL